MQTVAIWQRASSILRHASTPTAPVEQLARARATGGPASTTATRRREIRRTDGCLAREGRGTRVFGAQWQERSAIRAGPPASAYATPSLPSPDDATRGKRA